MRLFLAVFPPIEIAHRLTEAACDLAGGLAPKTVAWTRPEQIHLTLIFLGNVKRAKVEELARAVEAVCVRGKIHPLQARGLGCFPSPARPSIIWAGLAGAVAVLGELKRRLEESLTKLDYAEETRPFRPHLTIGRVKTLNSADRRHLTVSLPLWPETDFGGWMVERVDLMQSELSPAGAEYTNVQSFQFRVPTAA
jgi:RNA 2',3'-cyclic 3'-phosphodiesterase